MKLHGLVAAPLLAVGLATAASAEPRFQGLGFLPGYAERSVGHDVSADGCVVVGESGGLYDPWGHPLPQRAVRWRDGESEALAPFPGGGYARQAPAVSADGRVITGQAPMEGDWYYDGVAVWDHGIPIGIAPSSGHYSAAGSAASADGRVLVGWQHQNEGPYHHRVAFRYEAGAYGDLGWLPGGGPPSLALDVSADGSVVVGWATAADGQREAFRWEAGAMVGLGRLPGQTSSEAWGVSPDGSLVVGKSGNRAFLWRDGLMTELGSGTALAVRADGGRVLGASFVWTEAEGHRPLESFLRDNWGLDFTGWSLSSAHAMSRDGAVIVGEGVNPDGKIEAWLAVLGDLDCTPEEPPPDPPLEPIDALSVVVTEEDTAEVLGTHWIPPYPRYALARDGTLYMAASEFGILEADPQGELSQLSDAPAPQGITPGPNGLYGISGGSIIVRIGPDGQATEVADTSAILGWRPYLTNLKLTSEGVIYAADDGGSGCYKVIVVTPAGYGRTLASETGDPCLGIGKFPFVEIGDDGTLYLVAVGSGDVYRLVSQGPPELLFEGRAHGWDYLSSFAVGADGNLYVSGRHSSYDVLGQPSVYIGEARDYALLRVAPDGAVTELLGPEGDGLGNRFERAGGIAIDSRGDVFVAGHESNNVFEILPDGAIRTILDRRGDYAGNELSRPSFLAVDSADNLLVGSFDSVYVFKAPPDLSRDLDLDGDGHPNLADNCSAAANADQTDSDGDGFGNACDPDFNNDGGVGIADFMLLIRRWGSQSGDADYDPVLDLDENGAIGSGDYWRLIDRFGKPPGPSALAGR